MERGNHRPLWGVRTPLTYPFPGALSVYPHAVRAHRNFGSGLISISNVEHRIPKGEGVLVQHATFCVRYSCCRRAGSLSMMAEMIGRGP